MLKIRVKESRKDFLFGRRAGKYYCQRQLWRLWESLDKERFDYFELYGW